MSSADDLHGDRIAAAPNGGPHLTPADQDLVAAARDRQPRALGRLITRIENSAALTSPDREPAGAVSARPQPLIDPVRTLVASTSSSTHIVGVTGPPGVGKSSLTAALVSVWRARRLSVAVLAVDPSSPFSGGALLGDRVRMQHHATDQGVYIRSMSSRGHLGGLAVAAYDVSRVLEWAGFDVVIVETVGVGQSEVEVVQVSDTTVVVLAPGLGDSVQAAKAGVLEVADIMVVNKADLPGAQAVVRDLRTNLSMGHRGDWKPPILTTVSTQLEGIDSVVDQVSAHRQQATATGEWDRRRHCQIRDQITVLALAQWRQHVLAQHDGIDALVQQVAAGELDTHLAANRLIESWRGP